MGIFFSAFFLSLSSQNWQLKCWHPLGLPYLLSVLSLPTVFGQPCPFSWLQLSCCDGSKIKYTSLAQASFSASLDVSNSTCLIWIHSAPTPPVFSSKILVSGTRLTAHGIPGLVGSKHLMPVTSFHLWRARYRTYSYCCHFTYQK